MPLVLDGVADFVYCDWRQYPLGFPGHAKIGCLPPDCPDPVILVLHPQNIQTASPIHKRSLLQRVGGFREDVFQGQDRELHLRLACHGATFHRLPEVLYSLRILDQSLSSNYIGALSHRSCFLSHVRVVPNAVSSRFFQPPGSSDECRRRLGLPLDVPIVGVPGTLRPVKGHGFFLEAADRIVKSGWHGHFAVCGHGTSSYREQLDRQVDRLGLNRRVHFVGTLEDMRHFYGAFDLICVPSRSESFGRTVIEAFAMGVPVVATAVGGICETVDHCTTGLLVPYGDVRRLADSLVRLLEAPQLRARLSMQARAKARAEYREDIYQGRILELITEVARGGKHGVSLNGIPERNSSVFAARKPGQSPTCFSADPNGQGLRGCAGICSSRWNTQIGEPEGLKYGSPGQRPG